ncbi:Rieske (2Fe-2S) protein [Streptomyces capparidis]
MAAALAVAGGVAGALALSRRDGGGGAAPVGEPSGAPAPESSPPAGDGSGGSGGGVSVAASAVPVGGGVQVTTADGRPAFVVQPRPGQYAAFAAACTHSGCPVQAPEDGIFHCPCHGSEFDAATGRVLKGPATEPLARITVRDSGGKLELE